MHIFLERFDCTLKFQGFYRIGTLDRGGWERWFLNSSQKSTAKLMKKLEFVIDIEEGINNVTQAFIWP